MTYTFTENLSTDLAKVRFAIGDTNTSGAYLTDETITALLTSEGSIGGAAVACVKYIIKMLSQPDFKQDWLSVTNGEARKGYEQILKDLEQEYGISANGVTFGTSIEHRFRQDSNMEDGDWTP